MPLNSNLVYANQFLKPIADFALEVYKKTWSAENRVHYSSRANQLIDAGVDKDFIITIKPSFVRDFSATEKEFIYEIIRGCKIIYPQLAYLLEDLEQLLRKRGYQNERYFYLSHLTDNQFAYELDTKVFPKTSSRRTYYRKRSMRFGRKQLTLQEILEQYFFADIIELNRPRPKKKVRHKGYRDHGSLGSEFSKTLKQQAGAWQLKELEAQKKKREKELLEFLSSFAGWE